MSERNERGVTSSAEAMRLTREQILRPDFDESQRALLVSGVVSAVNETEYPRAVAEFSPAEMNLLTNREITVAYLIAMEGAEWFEVQKKRWVGRTESVEGALQKAQVANESQTIYGLGGNRRYDVYPDGRVCLLGYSTKDKSIIAKAKKLGFEII